MTRVAITGLGVLCSLGDTVESFWQSLGQAQCGIQSLNTTDFPGLRLKVAATLRDFDPTQHFSQRQLDLLDPVSQYLMVACRQAFEDADLQLSPQEQPKVQLITGSAGGGQTTIDQAYQRVYQQGKNGMSPLTIPSYMPHAGLAQVSKELGLFGPAITLSTACATGTQALGLGFQMVRGGQAPVSLVATSEAPFCFGYLKAWEAMRIVDSLPCRPFCKHRRGLSLAEGAAALVLESWDRAVARGAKIYGEVLGYGSSLSGGDLTGLDVQGAAQAMKSALQDAQVAPTELDYINAHGTGTLANDKSETAAVHQVFGAHATKLAISSTKSMHGHALGAAGTLEAVATVLALERGLLPPTINLREIDPECDLDYVPHCARPAAAKLALSNSFAFGGLNASLVLGNPNRDS